jgi:hypothetical protein
MTYQQTISLAIQAQCLSVKLTALYIEDRSPKLKRVIERNNARVSRRIAAWTRAIEEMR